MLKILTRLWSKKQPKDANQNKEVKYLIVGLGNIGPDYENTRHNIGFMVLNQIAATRNVSFEPARYGDKTSFRFKGRIFILVKPSTYMNLSGKAIHYWLTKEKIPIENLLVIVDDVALPLGTLRLKAKGSDGGHNGLASIISVLGTDLFPRLRFGIGDDFPKGAQVQYVLGKWEKWELEIIEPVIKKCGDLVTSFATTGIERTMNFFNTKPKAAKKKPKVDGSSEKTPEDAG